MSEHFVFEAADLAATESFGRRLAGVLFPGAVVALIGTLGAGKTHLVRAVAEGLGITDPRAVTSPTFVLIQEYDARLPIYHFDTYRLKSAADFAALGVHEYFAGEGVCFVEWADRVPDVLPADHLRITLHVRTATSRAIEVQGLGRRSQEVVRKLVALEQGSAAAPTSP
jgi:tRNA threonylcarbamoyladenosine biosynthesis protein TsaE